MKTILIVFPYSMGLEPFSGGIFKATVNLIRAIYESKQYDIDLLIPFNNPEIISLINKGFPKVKVISADFEVPRRYSDSRGFMRFKLSLLSIVKYLRSKPQLKSISQGKYDLVYFQEAICLPLIPIFSASKSHIVLHLHSYRFLTYPFILWLVRNRIEKFVDLLIAPTFSIINSFANVSNTHFEVIRTPYDSENTMGSQNPTICTDERMKFAFTGRISRIKRIDHFIKAIASLNQSERERIIFYIVGKPNNEGDREYEEELKQLASTGNLENQVKFLGYVSPIEAFIRSIDFGVLLSESEALSMSGLEFLAHKKPLIVYDTPGNNELIENGKGGIVVENASIEQLTVSIRNLVFNPEIRTQIIDSCEARSKLYSFKVFKEKVLLVLDKLLNKKDD